jgi:hypothetical protein
MNILDIVGVPTILMHRSLLWNSFLFLNLFNFFHTSSVLVYISIPASPVSLLSFCLYVYTHK